MKDFLSVSNDPMFIHFTKAEDYEKAKIIGVEPMSAKEIKEDEQESLLHDPNYIVEEKFDGTRATLHFFNRRPFEFSSEEDVSEYLSYCLLRGSGVEGGKLRIYNFFISHSDKKEKVDFLKKEFGIGGSCTTINDEYVSTNFSSSGYKISVRDIAEVTYMWGAVVERYDQLIKEGYFYPEEAYTRCFSRRTSKKTGWYCENTDSLPQLRSINKPELAGTILDGEMFIPNKPFKEVSSTLNCTWDKAIERQTELGFIVFHAFDITHYKGQCIEHLPLIERKAYLRKAVEEINSEYVVEVKYYSCDRKVPLMFSRKKYKVLSEKISPLKGAYPTLCSEFLGKNKDNSIQFVCLTPKAYYEYIVATGGEGVIIKNKQGIYQHSRGREYQKIKKFLTKDVILMGFSEPTKEYKGKFPNDSWDYWEHHNVVSNNWSKYSAKQLLAKGMIPVTKYYAENWVGNVRFGVVITEEDIKSLPKSKKFNIEEIKVDDDILSIVEVGECSGIDEEMRQYLTEHREEIIGSVIEVKANEIFNDTGKLRHPRFLRLRPDKNADSCTWKEHTV